MSKLYIPIIFGGAHENRDSYTEKLASVTKKFVEQFSIETEIIDARKEFEFCHANREDDRTEVQELRNKFTHADGFILVAPEYNHGYPGDLKNLLDSFYEEWGRKPVGIIGVSSGGIGGARMVEQLRLIAIALGMTPLKSAIHFSGVSKLFNDKDDFLEEEKYKKRFDNFLEELRWYAEALTTARKK